MGTAIAFNLTSQDIHNGGNIPERFTCHGKDISPSLAWEGAPSQTQSFVLIMEDPDAPGGTWLHWIVYNIPSIVLGFSQGERQGIGAINSWGKQGYGGPCPPSGVHHYHFKLYALDTLLHLASSPANLEQVQEAMKGHILGTAELIGLYP